MLPKGFDLVIENASGGASLVATVTLTGWKYGPIGELVYETTEKSGTTGPIADTGQGVALSVDNTTDKYLGGHGIVTFDSGGGSGDAYLLLATKPNGTNKATEQSEILVVSNSPAGKSHQFEI